MYFVSAGAGSPSKPAVVAPNGDVICIATSPENAAEIAAAMNVVYPTADAA
jgi:hypothetical protein